MSGGFAVVQPDSVLSINAVEGYPLEEFSIEAVNSQIAEAQKIASGNGSEQDIAEAKIEIEVRFGIQQSDVEETLLMLTRETGSRIPPGRIEISGMVID